MNQYGDTTPNRNGTQQADPMTLALAAPTAAIVPATPSPHLSDLDRWTRRTFGKMADELDGNELDQTSQHLLDQARKDKERWAGRDERMRGDQTAFELAGGIIVPLGMEHKTYEELLAAETQSYRSPIPWSFSTKMTAMLAGAGFRLHMAPERLDDTVKAQAVENYCRHTWTEMAARMRLAGGADPLWKLAHFGPLRGWMTVLLVPQSVGASPPQHWEIEDPIYVYPRFTRRRLARVTRQYTITAMEALDEYPEAEALLEGYKDDDDVECIGYYDEKYHCILLQGKRASQYDRGLIGRPVPHGIVDIDGAPVNPWLIIVPLGDLSAPTEHNQPSTRLYGPGILHGVHETVNHLNRLISMLLTQVGKVTEPPDITFIREGQQAPEPIKTERGSHNFLFDNQKYQAIDTAPNPGNFQPVFTFLLDMVSKLTFPSVFYGAGGASGYDTGILQKAALDIVLPWSQGLEFMVEHMFRRMLEITYRITGGAGNPESATHGLLRMQAQVGPGGRQIAGQEFDPAIIGETGVAVKVTLGRVLPQDEAAMTSFLSAMTSIGAMSPYTAMVKAGIEDPELEFQRIATYKFLQTNPLVAMLYARKVASMSDDEQLQFAIQLAEQMQQQQAQQTPPQAPGEQARQAGQANLPNTVHPTALQPGGGGATAVQQGAASAAGNSAAATLMASMGGSPERPAGG